MALRLKKDVQKASYYVWFLGAQEAKELRGERVLTSTIPRLIERARHQEPLKVTLQVSHKGLKIIQVCNSIKSNAAQFQSLSVFTCLNTRPRVDSRDMISTPSNFPDANYSNTKTRLGQYCSLVHEFLCTF